MTTTVETRTKVDRYGLTYRYLRGVMVAVLLLLVVSVAFQVGADGWCVLGSISAYYYTPVHTIFIGSLFALGAALIAYQGESTEEEAVLNLSGFMAFVVAVVPTNPSDACGANALDPSEEVLSDAVVNSGTSLLIVAGLSGLALLWLRKKRNERPMRSASRGWRRIVVPACIVVPAAEVLLFMFWRDVLIANGHVIAAVTMVAGLILVMLFNAYTVPRPPVVGNDVDYRTVYRSIAIAMAASMIVTTAAFWGRSHLVLALELVVILLFGAYWVVQSFELRNPAPLAAPPGGDGAAGAPARA